MYHAISDYALIGDCRATALVSGDGSLDWLCFPRFESPSIFAALLDDQRGGSFGIRPTAPFTVKRQYVPDTNVLETEFATATGSVMLRDLMPVADEADKRNRLTPSHQVLREMEGLSGTVEMALDYQPRPHYGSRAAQLRHRGLNGVWCDAAGAALFLHADAPLTISQDGSRAFGTVIVSAGHRCYAALSYDQDAPAVLPLLGDAAREAIDQSVRWWQAWTRRITYNGPYRDAVVRSALALKLLAYAPSGAIIAAPTTSLPERIGGERNWDYRYCWLRDASLTIRALLSLGCSEDAEAFLNWILHATRLTWPRLQVVYDVMGETRLRERELKHLDGYEHSRPVRVGNAAAQQQQSDIYGIVISAAGEASRRGYPLDRDMQNFLIGLGKVISQNWQKPDDGIWEARSGLQHYTLSKALCWVGLEQLHDLRRRGIVSNSVDESLIEREAIRQAVETRGFNAALNSYTQTMDGSNLDASLLLLPLYGYIDAAHPRSMGTLRALQQRLGRGSLLYRYGHETDDGLTPGEGAFAVCSFWAVECLARAGRVDEARADFNDLMRYGNDVGLFSEEIDPETGRALGNFPQAFTHIGLIDAALHIEQTSARATSKQQRGAA